MGHEVAEADGGSTPPRLVPMRPLRAKAIVAGAGSSADPRASRDLYPRLTSLHRD